MKLFVVLVLSMLACAAAQVSLAVVYPTSGKLQFQQRPAYTTTVTSGTGTVTVFVDTAQIGTCSITTTASSCTVNITTTGGDLTVGNHTAYSTFNGVNSNSVTFQVFAIFQLVCTTDPSNPAGLIPAGVNLQLIASGNKQGTALNPTGVVTFVDAAHNNNFLGNCTISDSNRCVYTVSGGLPQNNNYTINAIYNGDSVFDVSYASSVFLQVGGISSTANGATGSSTQSGTTTSKSTTGAASSTTGAAASITAGSTVTGASSSSTNTTGASANTATTGSSTGRTTSAAPQSVIAFGAILASTLALML